MNLRPRICYLLALLRTHSPDCKHCNARRTCGNEMVKRLEELNRRTPPHSLNDGNQGEVLQDRDTKPPNCSKSA